jgi:hypothetical protein
MPEHEPDTSAEQPEEEAAGASDEVAEEAAEPAATSEPKPAGNAAEGEASGGDIPDEELRKRLEEQLRRIRVQDLLLESVASILNLTARRIATPEERDLEQGRIGIEAVRAVLELLEPGPREQVREALSQVQVLYAREASGGSGRGGDEPGPGEPAEGSGDPGEKPDRPPGLWTPPGT